MKIAISGSTGFVGAHCVRHFANLGHEINALGRQSEAPEELLKYAEYTCNDLEKECPIIDADVLIHSAAKVGDQGEYEKFHKVNVEGTKKLLTAFKGNHFIYISSGSVYSQMSVAHKENESVETGLSNYGLSKLSAEKIVTQGAYDFKKTVLRPRAIYGTHDRVLIPRILQLKKGKSAVVPGDLRIQTCLTHVSNLLHAIDCSIKNQQKESAIYNVCDDESYLLRDVISSILKSAYEQDIKIKSKNLRLVRTITNLAHRFSLPFPLSPQSLKYLSEDFKLDISKIKNEVGYKPKANFFNSINEIKDWMESIGIEFIRTGDKGLPWNMG